MKELPRDWFQQLMTNFVPLGWRAKTVVAGGFARDPEQATDVDLWLLTGGGTTADDAENWMRARSAVLRMMQTKGWDQYLVGDEGGYGKEHHLILSVPNAWLGLTVQVLISDAADAQELVDGFDISTHAVAMKQVGETMETTYTEKGIFGQPLVLRFDTPADTLGRLQKICNRYGLTAKPDDVARLTRYALAAEAPGKRPQRLAA